MSACTRALFLSLFAAAVALGAAGCSFIPRDRAGAGETDLAPAEIDALAAAGRESYGRDPRERAAMDTAFAALARAARARAGDYELAWETARAAAWLADAERGRPRQKEIALEGIKYANSALAVRPAGAEALYYHAMCTGLLADADHTYGVDAMRRMVQNLTAAVAADERFDRAGAHRLLGILYTRAPGPPSGVGSSRRALKELRRAAELFPGDAENLRYLGEAEVEAGERAAAAEHLQAAVAAPAVPGRSAEQAAWRRDAAALLARLEAPEK